MAFNVQIDGVEKVLASLKRLDKTTAFEDILEAGATDIALRAKSKAPADVGGLRNAISVKKAGALSYAVVAQKTYAPFVEWGTKSKAIIPAELQGIASRYKGGGRATKVSAKEAIFEWARRNGIPEKRWYLVYRSIMTNGIRPHPFFFSSFFEVKAQIIKDIKNEFA